MKRMAKPKPAPAPKQVAQPRPCLPIKRRKLNPENPSNARSIFMDKAMGILTKIEKNMAGDILDLSDIPDVPEAFASPPKSIASSTNTNTNTTTDNRECKESDEEEQGSIVIYEYVGRVMDFSNGNGITSDLKEKIIERLLSGWHDIRYKDDVLRLVKYVKSRSMPRLHQFQLLEMELDHIFK